MAARAGSRFIVTARTWLAAPWGSIEMTASARGLTRVELVPGEMVSQSPACESVGTAPEPGSVPETTARRHLVAAAAAAVAYFEQRTPLETPTLAWEQVSPFARQVYRHLMAVNHGTTLTYGELAARCGRPGAARAVGRAMARNPWPLFVPCHRVLPAAGGLGGYGPGPSIKAWLLEHEGAGRWEAVP